MALLLSGGLGAAADALANPAQAEQAAWTTDVTLLTINERVTEDFEVLRQPDGLVLVPVQALAALLDTPATVSPTAPVVTLASPTTGQRIQLDAARHTLTQGETETALPADHIRWVTTGLLSKREVFLALGDAAQLLDVTLTDQPRDGTLAVSVKREIKATLQYQATPADRGHAPASPESPYDVVYLPTAETHVVEHVGVQANSTGSQAVTVSSLAPDTRFGTLWNTLNTTVEGHLLGQPYRLSAQTAMNNGMFGLMDAQANWHRPLWGGQLDAGLFRVGLSELVAPSVELLGLQWATSNAVSPGEVASAQPQRAAGQLATGEQAASVFLGRVAPQFRLPGLGAKGQLLAPQSNKFLAGGRWAVGVTDRLTLGVSAVGDTLIGAPKTPDYSVIFDPLLLGNPLGATGYLRDPNLMSGVSGAVNLAYQLSPQWQLTGEGALSLPKMADGVSRDYFTDGLGTASQWSVRRSGPDGQFQASLFRLDNNYYTPAGRWDNTLYDRVGWSVAQSGQLWGVFYDVMAGQTAMNTAGVAQGGRIDSHTLRGSLSRSLGTGTQLRASLFQMAGENEVQDTTLESLNLSLSQRLPLGLSLDLDLNRNRSQLVSTPFGDERLLQAPTRRQDQAYYGMVGSLRIPMGALGDVRLGWTVNRQIQLVSLRPSATWHRLTVSPFFQTTVGGPQQVHTLGLNLAYRWANNRHIGLGYRYGASTLPTLSSLLGVGSTQQHNHQFSLDFSDALMYLGQRLFSAGQNGKSHGVLECHTYLDRNRNGQPDPGEPAMPDIPVRVESGHIATSDEHGVARITSLSPGVHPVTFDYERLNLILTPNRTQVAATIAPGQRTIAHLGLMLTNGRVSGQVAVVNGEGRPVTGDEVLVSLLDGGSGQEVAFTYADANGAFVFGDLAPGAYRVQVDPTFAEAAQLRVLTEPITVDIPVSMADVQEQSGLMLKALKWL